MLKKCDLATLDNENLTKILFKTYKLATKLQIIVNSVNNETTWEHWARSLA